MYIVKHTKYDGSRIVMARKTSRRDGADIVHIFYTDDDGSKHPFYLSTGILETPHGLDTHGVAQCTVTDKLASVFTNLDYVARTVASAHSETLFGRSMSAEEIPYTDLVDEDFINLRINKLTTLFDSSRQKVDNVFQKLTCRYTASYLLDFTYLIVKNGQLQWSCQVCQIRLSKLETLPPGCHIVLDEKELRDLLLKRGLVDEEADDSDIDSDAVEYDSTRNELLD